MSFLNYSTREINFKIVYYGPGLSGKTTNIKSIYNKIKTDKKGKLVSLATETERTLFFDFFPLDLGKIKGYKVKFHLYTVPGQIYYSSSRKLILKGVDGVVFVADSQRERFEANIESIADMFQNDCFPGNVRELESKIKKLITFNPNLEHPAQMEKKKFSLKNARQNFECSLLLNTLNENQWNKNKTAEKLGISRMSLFNMLKKNNIKK